MSNSVMIVDIYVKKLSFWQQCNEDTINTENGRNSLIVFSHVKSLVIITMSSSFDIHRVSEKNKQNW